jgi:hypothetical protein
MTVYVGADLKVGPYGTLVCQSLTPVSIANIPMVSAG